LSMNKALLVFPFTWPCFLIIGLDITAVSKSALGTLIQFTCVKSCSISLNYCVTPCCLNYTFQDVCTEYLSAHNFTEVKVKFPPCFNRAPRHESVQGEWRYSSTHSFTSALDTGEWSASRLGHFTPRKRTPGTHWLGGWVSHRAGLDAVVRRIPSPYRDSNSQSSSS
jgi:hypothetical protein